MGGGGWGWGGGGGAIARGWGGYFPRGLLPGVLLSEGLLPRVAIVWVANARGAIDIESATRAQ